LQIAKYLKMWVNAVALLVLSLGILWLASALNTLLRDILIMRLHGAMQPLIALSVSLLVFPFVSVPAVESIVSRARSHGLRVSSELVKDYVDGCFTVFLLSVTELLLLVLYAFTHSELVAFATVAVLISLTFSTVILMSGLWHITRLMIDVTSEVSQV
ncbi:MAG: hypothetical protein QXJ97_13495, partial [Desulfurococcaceae archaeon]